MTVDEVFAELRKDTVFYDDSRGGVTFSGGEPLMQPEFLASLLATCRSAGIHTAVDTCGYAPRRGLSEMVPLTDLFLYDLKFIDEARHRQYTGVSNASILDNLVWLGQAHDNIWIRVPVIPTVNNDDREIEAIARFAASIPGVRQINVLPYHTTGIVKFRRLGQAYGLEDLEPPSGDSLKQVLEIFAGFGLTARVGG
jgi:pyruvate formate lyase activating enzyme